MDQQQESTAGILRRLPLLAAFIILLSVVLFIRLWYIQAVKGEYYHELAENNRIRPVKLRPPRGIIYDRSGRPLVENELVFDVSLIPEDAPNLDATIEKLSAILKIAPDAIRKALDEAEDVRTTYDPVKIQEEAPWDEVARVEAHMDDLPGAIIEPEHRRHYPYAGLAAHQLGYIGKVSQAQRKKEQTDLGILTGQGGLEKVYDKLLRGVAGRRMIQVNAAGRKVKDLGIEEPRPGTDIYLTIDLDAQKAAEEGLGSRAGAVVAMDPDTGEILALASHPAYDPNIFPRGISPKDWVQLMNDPKHPMYNRAIQSVYPPGSTFKIIVGLAGLESGVIRLDDAVNCKGFLTSGRRSYRCWKKGGHGTVSFHQALVESCDVYFYTMGDRIGWDRVAEYARKLGYGSLTGILLPDEKPGLIPTTAWKKKRTGEVRTFPPEHTRSITLDSRALQEVQSALVGVVNEPGGTAHGAATPLAVVAGKTGTAQVIAQKVAGRKLSEATNDHAWFVAYAPVEHPKIAVAVLVEHGGHGGSAAAPVARKVIEGYLKNVEPKTVR